MDKIDQVFAPIYQWISGPYASLAIKFIILFVVVQGIVLGIEYLGSYINRDKEPIKDK